MKRIAIITARGGSKRIPLKNIKEFCGKPIIAYSIEAAIFSGLFNEVMVSTDSEKIAEISKNYGAKVPFLRSNITSNDFATTSDVLEEVILEYKKINKTFDVIACLYPTAPFVTAERLTEAMNIFMVADALSLKAVVQYSYPPQRALVIRDNRLDYQFPEFAKVRSQDLEPIFHDSGQFYFCKTTAFLQYHSLTTPNTIPYILPETEVQDIDNFSDWEIAEIKYKRLHKL